MRDVSRFPTQAFIRANNLQGTKRWIAKKISRFYESNYVELKDLRPETVINVPGPP